ncbi:MAG: PQQ-binding-like beta-propeller repeat protein, partial [Aeoliella sp.]
FPENATATGLGLVTEGQLLLPLSGGQLGVFDLATGALATTLAIREDQPLGNLTYHRGSLLTQSAVSLARFDQLDQLRRESSIGLSQTPPNPQSLRIRGEIAWGEGDLDGAIDKFRQALDARPDDALIRLRMIEALLAGLKTDYARYREQSQLLTELVEDRAQRLDLLRLQVNGSLAADNPSAAFGYALKLYEIDHEGNVEPAEGHTVQSERWFAARMTKIWNKSEDSLRKEITASVEDLYQAAIKDASPAPVSRLVRYFGGVPAGRQARIDLASALIEGKRLAEAELLLLCTDTNDQGSQFGDLTPEIRDLCSTLCGCESHHRSTTFAEDELFPCNRSNSSRDWPDGKVLVEQQRIAAARTSSGSTRSRSRGPQQTRLEIDSMGLPWGGPSMIAIAEGGSELIGWNELGEVSQRISLEIESLENSGELADLACVRFGHFCFVGAGREVAALDLRSPNGNGPGPLLWASKRTRTPSRRSVQAWQLQRQTFGRMVEKRDSGGSDSRVGKLCAASPLGVVLRDKDEVRCFDPVDGELLWQRNEMPTNGEAFGDWRFLFLIKAGEQEGIVISMTDGSTVGNWRRPEGKWRASVAGNIVTSRYRGGRQEFKVTSAMTGELLVERSYAGGARLTRVDAESFVFVEPSGRVEFVDAKRGKTRFEQQLWPEPKLSSVHVLLAGNTLFLATNTRSQAQHNTAGNQAVTDAPVVTGHVYALDAVTGVERWERPATVTGQGLAMLQAPATPVLLFVSQLEDRKTSRSTKTTRVLCLDKRTGRSLARENKVPRLDSPAIAMRVDHGSQPSVTIDLRHTHLVLRFTETPRPPEPVAMADAEGTSKSVSAGLFGLMRKALNGSAELPFGTEPIDKDD